jgi:uncharacterized protein (TIGR02421 family)
MSEVLLRPPEAPAELVGHVLDCLGAGTPVRRNLPGGGRIHIDRPLPFICLHVIAPDQDRAARDLATANAAYLLAPDLEAAAPILNAVGRAMTRRFGTFLVVEVAELEQDRLLTADSASLPPFETIVTLQDRPAVRAAVEAFVEAMESVEVRYRSPRIELRPGDGEEWLGLLDDGFSHFSVAFAPVYRQPKTERIYPELRERVVANLFDALLRAIAAFLASAGGMRVSTHRALGRRVFVETVERVDRAIDRIAQSFDFLLAVTPINADAAWHAFRSGGFAVTPTLHYRPLAIEVDAEKRRLFSIPFENLEDPLLYDLYRQKQQELDLQLGMIAMRDTARFREASRVLYGPVEPDLRRAAEEIMARTGSTGASPVSDSGGEHADCHRVRRAAHRMIKIYRATPMRFAARVSLRSDLPAGLMVSGPRLMISRSTLMAARRVEALLSHEVGVHLFTYFAGDAQGLRLFRSGLAGYEGMQEGLAVLAEYLVGGMTAGRLRLLAARVIGCASMLDGADFPETYRLLAGEYGLSGPGAFHVALRLYRAGGLAKDAIYLRGLLEVLGHLGAGGSLDPFWMGKIAARHFPAMQELSARGLLQAPPIRPAFLSHPDAERRLAAARAGASPVDLLVA